MITAQDLRQISDLLDKKLDQRFSDADKSLDKKFDEKLAPIYKELKSNSKQLRSLKKDQKTMLILLDTEQMKQRKRITRVEQHLNLV